MKKTEITAGNIVRLTSKPEVGSIVVKVLSITGDNAEVQFGLVHDGQFAARIHYSKTDRKTPVRGTVVKLSDISSIILKGEKPDMAKDVKPLLKPSQQKAAGKSSGSKPQTQAEIDADQALKDAEKNLKKAQADKKAKDAKEAKEKEAQKLKDEKKAKAEKERAAKEKTEAKDRSKTLLTQMKPTTLVEADVAKEASAGRANIPVAEGSDEKQTPVETFLELTKSEAKEAGKIIGKAVKKLNDEKALALKTNLTAEEETERKRLEKTVRDNLGKFNSAAMEIGAALTIINQHKLYRSTHKTFEAYVAEQFELSRPQAYSVMTAARTFQAIAGEDQKFALNAMPSIRAAEAIAQGVDGMIADAGLKTDPEQKAIERQLARNVFELATSTAPKDKNDKPVLSPAHIDSVFNVVRDIAKTGTVEVDGKAVPLNLAKAAIGEQIAEQSVERQGRLNALLAERIEKERGNVSAASSVAKRSATLDAALNQATVSDFSIPDGVTPRLTLACSVHGRQDAADHTDQYIELSCGCHFVSTPEGLSFTDNKKADALKAAKPEAKPAKADKADKPAPAPAPAG